MTSPEDLITRRRANRPEPCCRQATNLTSRDLPPSKDFESVTLEVCTCGRRHFIARPKPGEIGMRQGEILTA